MSDTPATPAMDATAQAVTRALDAAQLATDAAHEAEAVLLARTEAAQAMQRTAKRTTLLAAVVGGAALVSLLTGTAIWWRASSDLHDAATIQAEAAAAFVARLAEMNAALDRMEAAEAAAATDEAGLVARIDQINELLTQRLPTLPSQAAAADPSQPMPGGDAFSMRIDALRGDILAAIAEAELSMAERLVQLTASVASAPPPATAAAASAAAPVTPRPSPVATRPTPRPAQPAQAAPKTANPFRYP
jgi:hypothetical protein